VVALVKLPVVVLVKLPASTVMVRKSAGPAIIPIAIMLPITISVLNFSFNIMLILNFLFCGNI
jgi:hypothetical protein